MSLQFLLDSQKKFQERMGNNFEIMTREERSAYIKEHGYFLMEEVTEMLREMPFHKSWKDYSSWDEEKHSEQEQLMREEAIDGLHFMINILLALDMNEAEIIGMYKEKNKLNYQRQEDSNLGYVNK
ncbi:dUTP diphosphatase [Bacillus wiedmannii]|nr:dUTP diphosphatase [Bacillus wiedmannii]PEN61574.1 hypothetical protein CN576_21295 [Bacillus wiedmannii]PHA62820.1 hypothetical protein COE75_16400 [Bacillus wiedmannii]